MNAGIFVDNALCCIRSFTFITDFDLHLRSMIAFSCCFLMISPGRPDDSLLLFFPVGRAAKLFFRPGGYYIRPRVVVYPVASITVAANVFVAPSSLGKMNPRQKLTRHKRFLLTWLSGSFNFLSSLLPGCFCLP